MEGLLSTGPTPSSLTMASVSLLMPYYEPMIIGTNFGQSDSALKPSDIPRPEMGHVNCVLIGLHSLFVSSLFVLCLRV